MLLILTLPPAAANRATAYIGHAIHGAGVQHVIVAAESESHIGVLIEKLPHRLRPAHTAAYEARRDAKDRRVGDHAGRLITGKFLLEPFHLLLIQRRARDPEDVEHDEFPPLHPPAIETVRHSERRQCQRFRSLARDT